MIRCCTYVSLPFPRSAILIKLLLMHSHKHTRRFFFQVILYCVRSLQSKLAQFNKMSTQNQLRSNCLDLIQSQLPHTSSWNFKWFEANIHICISYAYVFINIYMYQRLNVYLFVCLLLFNTFSGSNSNFECELTLRCFVSIALLLQTICLSIFA